MTAASAMSAGPYSDTIVLFDWNGTLVLDADRAREALNAVLAARSRPTLDADAFATEFSLPMADMFGRLGAADVECAEREWNAHMSARASVAREGSHEALRMLAQGDARLGVVSAAARSSVEYDLVTLGFETAWATVEAPTVDKFAVLERYRGGRARAFYVGDTVYDMTCARSAGYVAVGVSGGYTSEEKLRMAGAEHLITSLLELVDVIVPVAGRTPSMP